MVNNLKHSAGFGKSDHEIIEFDFVCYAETLKTNNHSGNRLNFNKGDYVAINEELSQLSLESPQNATTLSLWSSFTVQLNNIIDKHIPESRAVKGDQFRKPFINKDSRIAIRKKHQLWIKYLHCKSTVNLENFKVARNKCTATVRKALL